MAKKKIPIFNWEGVNKNNITVKGQVTAANIGLVRAELRRQGIVVKKIKRYTPPFFSGIFGKKIKVIEISSFVRQLATMITAGLPIVQSLDILIKSQTNLHLQTLLTELKQDIESGISLSDALAKHPKQFNLLFSNLVRAGEQSGSLDVMLGRIALYKEKMESIKSKIKKALFYPVTVVLIALLISMGMLIFIVPQFAEIFQSFGAELPAPTQFVIQLSHWFRDYWFLFILGIVGSCWGVMKTYKTKEPFAYYCDTLFLKLPIFGNILKKAAISRITRTLATTFAAGMPLLDALTAVSSAAGNRLYRDAILNLKDYVAGGQAIHLGLKNPDLFPSLVVQMIAVGEESGTLEFMLSKIADFYEEDVDNAVGSLSSLLEPVIMVVLGVVIGGLVIAMYLPIFKLGGVISAG